MYTHIHTQSNNIYVFDTTAILRCVMLCFLVVVSRPLAPAALVLGHLHLEAGAKQVLTVQAGNGPGRAFLGRVTRIATFFAAQTGRVDEVAKAAEHVGDDVRVGTVASVAQHKEEALLAAHVGGNC